MIYHLSDLSAFDELLCLDGRNVTGCAKLGQDEAG